MRRSPYSWLLVLFGRLERGVARRGGGIGLADGDAVGQPQIDGDDVARQQLLVAVEIDQSAQRLLGLAFRQQHLDAVFQMQVPAPFGDQHRGFDRLRDRRIALEQREEILRLMLGAVADHQRQRGETLRHEGFQHGAVGGDQINAAVLLPEREGLALLDLDAQPVGIKLEHGGVRDPRIGHQADARLSGVEEQQRRAAGDAGKTEDVVAADFMFAGERDFGNAEADAVGRGVADVLDLRGDHLAVAAFDHAVKSAGEQQQGGGRGTGAARHF